MNARTIRTTKTTEQEKPAVRIGRPPIPEEERLIHGSIRLTAAQWEKLGTLGAAWLRKSIDDAKTPRKTK
ncbi:hypothetical protein [Paraburkholderia sp. J8-2]|uniref:hypothetical protein n=1 Tax=Paraburkholderia sp. J8-2 TaxID=2805440 RepID=UPI002AB6E151|nr:hypothetical protein [Paraburkholderia sp. J8-2]